MEPVSRPLSPATAAAYRSILRTHLEPYWGHLRVLDMDRKVCREWAETLTATREDAKPLSNRSRLLAVYCQVACGIFMK